jgi:hypothetical protein
MIDPEFAGQDPLATAAPAATQNPGAGPEPAIPPPPATAAPRKRRRWVAFTVAAVVVVLGIGAGLVIFAPRTPPPVLRPAGLAAGPSTANSISFHWSRPRTGPLPDKYLILSNGTAAGSVAGTVTSYRGSSLTPATTYQYNVVAVRDGKRSAQSALVTVRTLTPPIALARLQGSWSVYVKITHRVRGVKNGTVFWGTRPACPAGACDVVVREQDDSRSFIMRLTRSGAVYQGHATLPFTRCGPAHNSIADPTTVKYRVRITAAGGEDQAWDATTFTGTMVGTTHYVSSATFYCPAITFKASLSGNRS